MSFTLDTIVPWGRNFDEYVAMFGLTDTDLTRRILGCGDGPASFNAELTQRGGHIISADPLYQFSAVEIRNRIDETYATVMDETRKNAHEFTWATIKSVEELGRVRMAAMQTFLTDYALGLSQNRYINAELPKLPFADHEFDFALCSHFLFLYSEQCSEDFHVASIKELARVAHECRIFPLMELGTKKSRHTGNVLDRLTRDGYNVTIDTVPYEFQRGGNEMMRITTR